MSFVSPGLTVISCFVTKICSTGGHEDCKGEILSKSSLFKTGAAITKSYRQTSPIFLTFAALKTEGTSVL